MIARFDHRPMLTAVLALATIVLLVVVVSLSTLLFTGTQGAAPTSVSDGPAAHAASGAFSNLSPSERQHAIWAAKSGHFDSYSQ
jgi:hypothetical protein